MNSYIWNVSVKENSSLMMIGWSFVQGQYIHKTWVCLYVCAWADFGCTMRKYMIWKGWLYIFTHNMLYYVYVACLFTLMTHWVGTLYLQAVTKVLQLQDWCGAADSLFKLLPPFQDGSFVRLRNVDCCQLTGSRRKLKIVVADDDECIKVLPDDDPLLPNLKA